MVLGHPGFDPARNSPAPSGLFWKTAPTDIVTFVALWPVHAVLRPPFPRLSLGQVGRNREVWQGRRGSSHFAEKDVEGPGWQSGAAEPHTLQRRGARTQILARGHFPFTDHLPPGGRFRATRRTSHSSSCVPGQ